MDPCGPSMSTWLPRSADVPCRQGEWRPAEVRFRVRISTSAPPRKRRSASPCSKPWRANTDRRLGHHGFPESVNEGDERYWCPGSARRVGGGDRRAARGRAQRGKMRDAGLAKAEATLAAGDRSDSAGVSAGTGCQPWLESPGRCGGGRRAVGSVRSQQPAVWTGDRARGRTSRWCISRSMTAPTRGSPSGSWKLSNFERVAATFFMVGSHVESFPASAAAVAGAGHEIGNHTYSHAKLHRLGPRRTAEEVRRAHEAIVDATGTVPRSFRTPHGYRSPFVRRAIAPFGYLTFGWTFGVWDSSRPGAETIRRRVRERLRRGPSSFSTTVTATERGAIGAELPSRCRASSPTSGRRDIGSRRSPRWR